jgi:muramidase (phage lysozyme)
MVDLPKVSTAVVTSTAPRSSVSPGQIQGNTDLMANALGKVANASMDIATDMAKTQAADDLQNQKVTLNADGTVNVVNPANSVIFGKAGEAYNNAVQAGTIAQHSNVISQEMNDIHQKYPTDPAGFKTAADAWKAQYLSQHGGGEVGQAIAQQAAQLQTQHLNAITNTAASTDIDNQKKSITASIEDQKNTAIALARQGGTDTPQFQQAVGRMNASYDALATNPLFKMPQDQIDLEKKNTTALLQGEALVAHVDATFNKRGKAQASEELQSLLTNPNLREVDRSRLYTQGLSRLAYLTGDAKANIDANRQITTQMEEGLAKHTVKAEDPAVGLAIQRARDIGDTEGAQRITAAAAVQQHLRAVNPLPDAIKAEVLGVPGGVVNQAIPAEGRALLNTIASTESAGRYNVRYGGNGDKTFQGYTDHPRIAEPITSGPDVGKTSSAAGRYQFIAPTWDAQAKKLGLTDFSPANQDAAAWDLAQTEYKAKTGKDLLTTLKSGQTADVLPALSGQWASLPGGRQPAGRFMASSAGGMGGFTAEQVQQNPFLLSAYVRTLAADPELRVQSAKQTAEAVGKGIDNGILPSPAAVAEVNQAAALYPDKMGKVADEMNGRLAGQKIAALPQEQQDQVVEAYKRAADGADVHHMNLAAAALKQVQDSNKNLQDHPYAEAANRGWTQTPAPLDPSQPDTIAPALAQRAALGARIGGLNHTPPPPILDKDEVPKLQSALQGPNGAAVLGQIAQGLRPDEMQRLIDGDGFKESVTAMSRSGDPAKMNAAYSFMDTQQRQNPLQFDREFPAGLKDLRAWQSNLAFYPPDEAAKRLMRQYDPAQSAAYDASVKVADTALKNVSAANVVSKFSTGWGPIGTGARTPVSTDAGIAAGALKADYDKNYRDGYAATGDPTAADKFAMEKLNLKYAMSPANGNRVMANAPERYYPEVAGSHDWIGQQLDHEIAQATAGKLFEGMRTSPKQGPRYASPATDAGAFSSRQYQANRALVPDAITEREIASGKPPSYQVVVQDSSTGRWGSLSGPKVSDVNLRAADAAMSLTPQERALYQRHLTNLTGPGGVDNPDGSRSTVYVAVQEHDGKFYNIPTVWNGKREVEPYTRPDGTVMDVPNKTTLDNVEKEGWDKFPSYPTPDAADARYGQMHAYLDKDTTTYMASKNGLPRRIRFDPSEAFAAHAKRAEDARAAVAFDPGATVQP